MIHKLIGVLLMGLGIAMVAGVVFGTGMSLTAVGSCITLGLLFGGLALIII